MESYPAIRAKMGSKDEGWTYYMVKMKMRDVAKNIEFVSDLDVPQSTLEILQRFKSESRINSMIVPYLQDRPDRFFSSIIVACLGGNASFQSIAIEKTGDEVTDRLNENVQNSLGVLSLEGGHDYYALDGQHRLGAIKNIIEDKIFPADSGAGFLDEEISVIILRANKLDAAKDDDNNQWRRMFRRVFTSLNRYTKPTDRDTNILMDDDDIIAITTRNMIEQFGPFQWEGEVLDNAKIALKGKNLQEHKPHLTTLQTLYEMNELFLSSADNETVWVDLPKYKQKRPEEQFINDCTDNLTTIWQSLLDAVPELGKNPKFMRINNEDAVTDVENESENNFFFRPNIQEHVLARLIRHMIDEGELDLNAKTLQKEFEKINKLPSSLFSTPWRDVLITFNDKGKWVMRPGGNDNKAAKEFALNIALWITGVIEPDDDGKKELKDSYDYFLTTAGIINDEKEKRWKEILDLTK